MSERDKSPTPEVIRHSSRDREFEFALGDPEAIAAIGSHIEQHVGHVESVWHEIMSDLVHIDLHWVRPQERRPFHTLVTSGMSDRPMNAPEGQEKFRYSELVLNLPGDWPLTQEAFENEQNYWPIRLLKQLARFPHEFETWLWVGQSVGAGDHPEPFHSSTSQCAALIAPCVSLPAEFSTLSVSPEKTVYFFAVLPIYQEELLYRLNRGTDALFERFENAGIDDVVNPARENVCKRSRWRLPWRRA